MNKFKITLCACFIATPFLLRALVKYGFRLKTRRLKDNYNYRQIFVTFNNFKCLKHVYNQTTCGDKCSYSYMLQICEFVLSAKHSICMCMYMVTSIEIREALMKAHSNGVQIKLITDKVMSNCKGSQAERLKNAGVLTKTQTTDNSIMHHKFCLVDENHPPTAKVMFGTLNLTCQGVCTNWDQLVFTNNPNIIQRFKEEFEYLWQNTNFCFL